MKNNYFPIFAIVFSFSFSGLADASWVLDPCMMMEGSKEPCKYKVEDKQFTILANGNITFSNSSSPINTHVRLPAGFDIDSVRDGVLLEDSIVFNFDISDGDYGSSLVARLSLKDGTALWQQRTPSFNSSKLLVEKNSIYVGGLGFVAKLNALDGSILWINSGLYERDTQAYNSFQRPKIVGPNVVFTEQKVRSAKYNGVRSIVANKVTGAILSK